MALFLVCYAAHINKGNGVHHRDVACNHRLTSVTSVTPVADVTSEKRGAIGVKTLSAHSVDEAQLAELDKARSALPTDSALAETLDYLATSVRCGHDVTVLPDEVRLTPNQAAKLLSMSRTHLYKLLDAGVIKSISVGRDRRIKLDALRDYQAASDRDKADLATRFAHRDANRDKLLDHLAASEDDAR